MSKLGRCAVAMMLVFSNMNVAEAHADPSGQSNPPIECPDTHAHVWHEDQCDDIQGPFSLPGTGHGGSGGLLGFLGHLL